MAKAVYVGIDSKARKMKKAYIGIGGTARKVKKMYIGDSSGKARLCYSAELEKVGMAAGLDTARYALSSTRVGGHVLFAGGAVEDKSMVITRYVPNNAVDAYDAALTRNSPTTLSERRAYMGAAAVGGYALFAGGVTNGVTVTSPHKPSSVVDAYNASLTRTSATKLVSSLVGAAGGSIGNHAIFAGGANRDSDGYYIATTYCSIYDASLTRTSNIKLTTSRYCALSASVGDHVLFAGGHVKDSNNIYECKITSGTTTVEVFDSSLTKSSVANLSNKAYESQGVSFGKYALFCAADHELNAYDSSLTRTVVPNGNSEICGMGATSVGDYAIFAGGTDGKLIYSYTAVYDTSLTKVSGINLNISEGRRNSCGGAIGDYALIAGGVGSEDFTVTGTAEVYNTVDVYTA